MANSDQEEVININWTSIWQTAEQHGLGDYETISIALGCSVLFFSTVLGAISNALAFKYFLTKTNIFFNALKIVAVTDMVICQLSTFYGISLVASRAPLFFSHVLFCWAWNVLWKLVTRFSLHLVAIQSMIRTIKILLPFQILSNSVLTIVIVIDVMLMSIILCVNRTISEPLYTKTYASCMEQRETENIDIVPLRWCIMFYATLPYPFILVCCVLCTVALIKQNLKIKGSTGRPRQLAKRRTHSVISILAFSITGLILNIPPLIAITVRKVWYRGIKSDKEVYLIWLTLYGQFLFRNVSVTLNSVLNPYIFYWRMTDFRSYVGLNVVRPIVIVIQELVGQGKRNSDVETDGRNGFAVEYNIRPAKVTVLKECSILNTLDTIPTRKFSSWKSQHEPEVNDTVIVHRSAVNCAGGGLYEGQSEVITECQCECCFLEANRIALDMIAELETDDIGYMIGNSVVL